ncbi:acylglycerol lipase [Malassezia obtusa]|uniref:Acylglycerol lipase n=1 Tax=Malassezia obtusa TaxID=76774 RepID=A0AAF0E3F9_9BASI|nr:acylglycerol lipase [Malassezia obtusa]
MEREAIYENDAVKVTRRRVYLSRGKPVLDTSLTDSIKTVPHKLGECTIDGWINYYIWEMPGVSKPMNADVYLVHGINDYSGKVMPQALGLMMSGFRTVALDMPGFGRSTGLHAYVPTLLLNTNALDAVMYHVRMWDEVNQLEGLESRKRYAQGSSMGGFTVLYHAAMHPPVASVKQGGPAENRRLALDGVAVSAPMLQIAPESRPNMFIEAIGRLLSVVAGRLPLARAIKGNVSDDPKYVQALTSEWNHLNEVMSQIQCPVAIHHGSNDRVTSPDGSRAFFDRLHVQPKMLRIWPGIEHAMLKSTPEMDVPR